jgi:thermitase
MNFIRRASLAPLFAVVATIASAQTVEFAPREVLVKFKGTAGTSSISATQANAAIGAQNIRVIPRLNVNHVRVPTGMSLDDALFYYGGLPSVEYAEKNSKHKLDFTPNDSQFNSQYAPQKIKLPQAWDLGKGSPTVIVAILDTGIDLNHEDLKNKLVPGFDFSDNDSDPTAAGDHGVHCAGIAAAETHNSKGIAGGGFNTKIMPLKIFPNATDAVVSAAIIHAADNGAKVISMSFGSYSESITEKNAVNYAWGKGVILCGTAGNDGINMKRYPGGFDNVICVGATGVSDIKSGYSNHGSTWVDVAAPGDDVLSTVVGGYGQMSGTSMACPLVAGVAALLKGTAPPNTTNAVIRAAIENTTDPVPGNFFKKGRINAFKAMQTIDPGSATVSPPIAVELWDGVQITGGAADLLATDPAQVLVTSTPSTLGHLAGAIVTIDFNGPPTNLREATALLEINGVNGLSGQLFLWNYSSQKFVLIKAIAIRPTGVKREKLALPLNLSNYVSGGEMRLGVRAIGPKRAPREWGKGFFDFKLGFVQVATRENT